MVHWHGGSGHFNIWFGVSMVTKMPKFSIKDLMIATAMVAVGLATSHVANSPNIIVDESILLLAPMLLALTGWGIVGAGVLYPFGRWRVGIMLGVIISFLAMLLPNIQS